VNAPHPIAPETVDIPSQAGLIRAAFERADLTPMIQAQLDRLHQDPTDAGAYMTLGVLYQLFGQKENALACQDAALHYARAFRQPVTAPSLRLLAVVTVGDLMANTPIELLLEGRPVEITRVFVDAVGDLPPSLPDHDLAILAIGESDRTRQMLEQLQGAAWPRALLNNAGAILDLARDRLWRKLQGAPGLVIPPTMRVDAAALAQTTPPPGDFPLIVRPVDSHAGKGLERIDDPAGLKAYLAEVGSAQVYVSRFVDYAGADGHFRKYRIAFFGGRPYLAHMAVGDDWMVHYLNAGMATDPAKRAEEAVVMAGFDEGFAVRHAAIFAEMSARLGLDYYAIDCAETPDGDLLLFEADVGMIVHDLDPPELYPYKKPQMAKVMAAFEAFLRERAG
jgi:glutathione synthase/RimK-type ligase-like ATP-grasp enzyme